MKKSILTVVAIAAMLAGAALAQSNPSPNPHPAPGQKCEQRQGKKLGPQDGTGPIHTPGTGGGTGTGRRTGRK
jgi:hypothetical protein